MAGTVAGSWRTVIVGEERTREVFGDYISVYNFRQSIEDKDPLPNRPTSGSHALGLIVTVSRS